MPGNLSFFKDQILYKWQGTGFLHWRVKTHSQKWRQGSSRRHNEPPIFSGQWIEENTTPEVDGWRKGTHHMSRRKALVPVAMRREEGNLWEGLSRQGRHDWGKRVAGHRKGATLVKTPGTDGIHRGWRGNVVVLLCLVWGDVWTSHCDWVIASEGWGPEGVTQVTFFLRTFWFWRKRR